MNIAMTQETPHPIFEVQGYAGTRDFNAIIAWLHRTDLPDDLSLNFEGGLYRFRTRIERVCFAMGFDKAFDLTNDEPKLGTWNDDGTAYYVLVNADSKEDLERLATLLLQELFLSKWTDHLDDFYVHCSNTCLLLITYGCWNGLSVNQKRAMVARCQGFADALSSH